MVGRQTVHMPRLIAVIKRWLFSSGHRSLELTPGDERFCPGPYDIRQLPR